MEDLPPKDYNLPPQESPEIQITLMDGRQVFLRWDNTSLFSFVEGNGVYDHVVHTLEDGKTLFFLVEHDNWEGMLEMGYPYHRLPNINDKTRESIIGLMLDSLDEEVTSILEQ